MMNKYRGVPSFYTMGTPVKVVKKEDGFPKNLIFMSLHIAVQQIVIFDSDVFLSMPMLLSAGFMDGQCMEKIQHFKELFTVVEKEEYDPTRFLPQNILQRLSSNLKDTEQLSLAFYVREKNGTLNPFYLLTINGQKNDMGYTTITSPVQFGVEHEFPNIISPDALAFHCKETESVYQKNDDGVSQIDIILQWDGDIIITHHPYED